MRRRGRQRQIPMICPLRAPCDKVTDRRGPGLSQSHAISDRATTRHEPGQVSARRETRPVGAAPRAGGNEPGAPTAPGRVPRRSHTPTPSVSGTRGGPAAGRTAAPDARRTSRDMSRDLLTRSPHRLVTRQRPGTSPARRLRLGQVLDLGTGAPPWAGQRHEACHILGSSIAR